MDQQPAGAPPPYSAEYGKPPPYFAQPPPPPEHGWNPPPPAPTHGTGPQTSHQGGTGTRPTVITVTHTPAYVVASQPQPTQQSVQVLQLGNCPACRIGFLRSEFDICGVLIAIIFFPIGILCCLCMMEKRCSHCGARF